MKRNLAIIIILLITLLAIALVWWVFERRLQRLNSKGEPSSAVNRQRILTADLPLTKQGGPDHLLRELQQTTKY